MCRHFQITINDEKPSNAGSFLFCKQIVSLKYLVYGTVTAKVHDNDGKLVAEYDNEDWTVHDETILPPPVILTTRQSEVLKTFSAVQPRRPRLAKDVAMARRLHEKGLLMEVGIEGSRVCWVLNLRGEKTLAHIYANERKVISS